LARGRMDQADIRASIAASDFGRPPLPGWRCLGFRRSAIGRQ
jgi:hypothetical protein